MAKNKKELLPFPRLLVKPEACLGCGYPLDGIPAPGSCPECGMEFYDRFSGLQIAGVAKKSGGPAWRRAVWIVIAIISFLYFNVIGVLIFTLPWMALVIFLAIVAGVLAMIFSSPNKKGAGSEYFTFVRSGFSRWPTGTENAAREFRAWDGVKPGVMVKPVSRVWASMKLVHFDERGKREVLLSGGFRCRTEQIPVVEQAIGMMMRGESIADDHELIGQLDDPDDPSNNPVDAAFNMV